MKNSFSLRPNLLGVFPPIDLRIGTSAGFEICLFFLIKDTGYSLETN